MTKRGQIIVANAIIWGAVTLAAAFVLQDTGYFGKILPILGGGAAGSILVGMYFVPLAGAGKAKRRPKVNS